MFNRLCKLMLASFFIVSAAHAQKLNPASQINWPNVTGSGAPTATCNSANYGQPYTDTAVTPNTNYTCGTGGWNLNSGGSGATTLQTRVNNFGNPLITPTLSTPSSCTVFSSAATITGWSVTTNLVGSVTFDIDVVAATTTPFPGASYSIVSTHPPTLTGSTYATSTTLTGWTTSIAAGSAVCVRATGAAGITSASLILNLQG